jgi:hypothetical protein
MKCYEIEGRIGLIAIALHFHERQKTQYVFAFARMTKAKEEMVGKMQNIWPRLLHSAAQTNQETMGLVGYELMMGIKGVWPRIPIQEAHQMRLPDKEVKIAGGVYSPLPPPPEPIRPHFPTDIGLRRNWQGSYR